MGRYTTISRHGHVEAPAADILAMVSSTEGFTEINPHRTADPDLVVIPSGAALGIGSGFAFRGREGRGTQIVAELTDTHVLHDIDMGAMGRSQQRIVATPAPGGGCDIDWTMTLDAGHNPVLRVFGLMANRVLGPTLEVGVGNLAASTDR